ncbi:MAG: FAD-binding oxidoreductase [Acidobacteria bacterium]|nr:FAD-binding oxidoreductase [Acidobacteriota bacterium]
MSSTTATRNAIASRFEGLLGSACVVSEPASLERYAIEGSVPGAVLLPEDAEQIASALRIAGEERWPVVPFGGGTHQHIGRVAEDADVVLSTERMNTIAAYDPGDLTIALAAGATVAQARAACAQHRQLLPIEAGAGSTIGGAMAVAATGPLQCAFGGIREFCIGVTFVTGDGLPGRGGGRVVKNVAGYDLMKLMIGSHGSLGVITSANFKLFPMPPVTATFLCEFDSAAALFRFRDSLVKSPMSPLCAEVISPAAAEYLKESEPRDPDSWSPNGALAPQTPWLLALRFAASDRVLARLRHDLASFTSQEIRAHDENRFWGAVSQLEKHVLARHPNAMFFQVSLPISESAAMIEAAEASATNFNFVAGVVGRATVGSFTVVFLPLAIDPPAVTQFAGAASDFRSRLSRAASAVVVRCPREAKHHFDIWGSTPTDIELMRKIKRALDPYSILNRGRFFVE